MPTKEQDMSVQELQGDENIKTVSGQRFGSLYDAGSIFSARNKGKDGYLS